MNKYKFTLIVVLIYFTNCPLLFANSLDGINLNLHVGSCNNNDICEQGSEDFFVCPADCTPVVVLPDAGKKSSGGLVMNNVFNDLTVEVSYNSATIKWNSVIPIMSNLKWGQGPDYKDGVIRNINYLLNHKIEISNLKEGTNYYFNIEAENLLGKTSSLENQIFRTLSLPDTTPPGNVKKVTISSDISGITVSWLNPTDLDFDYVRVMKNTKRYYANPNQGILVYEGKGNYFTDSKVIDQNKYFYSLFARDRAGNYSSGTLINIIHNPLSEDLWGKILTPETEVKFIDSEASISQSGLVYDFIMDGNFRLSAGGSIDVKINYLSSKKDDDLWFEIKNSNKNIEAQYLFKHSLVKEGDREVRIPPFEKAGTYDVSINRYDGDVSQIIRAGTFQITKSTTQNLKGGFSIYLFWFIIIFIILLLIILFFTLAILPKIFKKRDL